MAPTTATSTTATSTTATSTSRTSSGRVPLRALLVAALGVLAVLVAAGEAPVMQPTGSAAAETPLTLAVIGDYGGNNGGEYRLATLVAGWKPDAVATVGDNLYPTPADVTGTDKYDLVVGKFFCAFLAGVPKGPNCAGGGSAVNRFFPATGNHDYSDGPIANYLAYFNLPGAGVTSEFPTGSEQYYDVRLGPVHLYFIDSQLTGALSPEAPSLAEQQRWLQRSMAASTAPWKLVLFHHPAYSSGTTYGSTPAMQWPFGAWGADLVLSGHHHSFERIVRSDTTYYVVGLGGASRFPFDPPIEGSEVRFNDDEGALRLTITSTSLVADFITTSGVLIDRYTLSAAPPPPPTTTGTSTTVPRTTTTTTTSTTVPRTTTTSTTSTTVPRTTTTTSTTSTTVAPPPPPPPPPPSPPSPPSPPAAPPVIATPQEVGIVASVTGAVPARRLVLDWAWRARVRR